MADAQYRLGRKAQALELFYQIDRDKNSPQRSRAVQRIASIELENKNYKKAIGYLRESIDYSRNPLEENETFSGLMHAYLETGKIDSTIFFADKVIGLGNVTPDNVPTALLIKAKASTAAGKDESG
jgi:tetratricopeptide (TPR) repeat protein